MNNDHGGIQIHQFGESTIVLIYVQVQQCFDEVTLYSNTRNKTSE